MELIRMSAINISLDKREREREGGREEKTKTGKNCIIISAPFIMLLLIF
jgi:hypothetical protein